jgi:hypothetical protein
MDYMHWYLPGDHITKLFWAEQKKNQLKIKNLEIHEWLDAWRAQCQVKSQKKVSFLWEMINSTFYY